MGQAGIEAYYDDHLGGQPGLVSSDIDKAGRRIPIGRHSMQQPRHGSDITLAIDRTIQHIIEQELTVALKRYDAAAGSILVTNPTTGEILGLANRPTFDPGLIHQSELGPELQNRVSGRMYEPGSTFKLVTMAAGLNEGLITPDSNHNNPGEMEYGGQDFKNWDEKTYPNQTMTKSVGRSSTNTWIYLALEHRPALTWGEAMVKWGVESADTAIRTGTGRTWPRTRSGRGFRSRLSNWRQRLARSPMVAS